MSSKGYTAAFLEQDRRKPAVIGMVMVTALSFLVVLLRLFARGYMMRELGWDDYLITAAQLVSWVVTALSIMVLHYGAGQHLALLMKTPETLVLLYKWLVAAQLVYMVNLWLCRISGLAFYARLNPMPRFQLYLRISFTFVTAVYISQTLIIALQCIPLAALWHGAKGTCMGSNAVFVSTSVLTIMCDSLVLLLPLNIVFSLKVDLARRLVLMLILCMGVFAVVTSGLRMVAMVAAIRHPQDATWYFSVVMVWSCTEISTAIIALSLPALRSLFVKVRQNRSTAAKDSSNSESVGLQSIRSRSTKPPIFEGPGVYRSTVDVGSSQERLWGVNDGHGVQVLDTVKVDIDEQSSC